ncbi:LysM peptidoglycan-binding domain-containing protein [Oceanihabitans sediminis]|uniref:LysM peptidoglycan-binding domain-containing protein n=1 Tax=Oceanihabitans sediminis TaxID=1812012 RepID=UPI00299E8ED1|nr:LysM peptidoglycan-binding domain-containing protein [Oceanihabitans sediminis]MDX1277902.1 LysM peptidoglycan-binding domain-containing protein [Oceanihabitans sediminis]
MKYSLIFFVLILFSCKEKTDIYTVKSGDTLSEIADSYGIRLKHIERWNNYPKNLFIGQKLKIHKSSNSNTDFINKIGGNKIVNEIEGVWVSKYEVVKFKKDKGDIFKFYYESFNQDEDIKNILSKLNERDEYPTSWVYLIDWPKGSTEFYNTDNGYLLAMDDGCPLSSFVFENNKLIYPETNATFEKVK